MKTVNRDKLLNLRRIQNAEKAKQSLIQPVKITLKEKILNYFQKK